MNTAQLIHMANQIAKNFAVQGEASAAYDTAQHIRDFWDPRMKDAILKCDRSSLSPIAAAAIERLSA